MISKFEQAIYNCWLSTSRKKLNKPFRIRKDWNGFEDKPEYIYVKKLAIMLRRYDNINIDEYIEAPYHVYPEKIAYQLQFYTTLKAMTCFKIHLKKKYNLTDKQFKEKIKKVDK